MKICNLEYLEKRENLSDYNTVVHKSELELDMFC